MVLSDEEYDSLGFTFIWRIENFIYCCEDFTAPCVASPDFLMTSFEGDTNWCLLVYPLFENDKNLIKCSLTRTGGRCVPARDPFEGCVSVDYQVSILASDGSLTKTVENEGASFTVDDSSEESLITKEELFDQKERILPQGTLTIHCRMWESNRVCAWLGQAFARTRLDVQRRSYLFTIPHFSAWKMPEEKLYHIAPDLKCKLVLSVQLVSSLDFEKKIKMYITQPDTTKANWARLKISIMDSKGSLHFSSEDDRWFEGIYFEDDEKESWDFPFSILKSTILVNKSQYLPNDTLSLQCDCMLLTGDVYEKLEINELGPYTVPHVNTFIPEVHKLHRQEES